MTRREGDYTSGDTLFTSQTNRINVNFTSDWSVREIGFTLNVRSIHCSQSDRECFIRFKNCKQEYIPVQYVPPARYRTRGLCLTETPSGQRPPGQGPPWQRSPRQRPSSGQEPPGQKPPSSTETHPLDRDQNPLDRDPNGQIPLWTAIPSGGTLLWIESQTGVKILPSRIRLRAFKITSRHFRWIWYDVTDRKISWLVT